MGESFLHVRRVIVEDPPIAKKMFGEADGWSVFWLLVRVYLGWSWVAAGWHKVLGEGWSAATLRAYWERAVVVPETGRAAISYDWYRWFLQLLIDQNAETWMTSVVAWGEVLVGAALILGAFVGIVAFFGAFMNMNFMLAGSASTNPVLLMLAIFLMLAWKNAGWWGLDRWLLPSIGTPWARVTVVRAKPPEQVRTTL